MLTHELLVRQPPGAHKILQNLPVLHLVTAIGCSQNYHVILLMKWAHILVTRYWEIKLQLSLQTSSSWLAFITPEGAILAAGVKNINRLAHLCTQGSTIPICQANSGTTAKRVTNQSLFVLKLTPWRESMWKTYSWGHIIMGTRGNAYYCLVHIVSNCLLNICLYP